MVINGILITIILIIIMLIFINNTTSTSKMGNVINEQFIGSPGTDGAINGADHRNYVKTGQDKFNLFTNIVNLTDPAVSFSDRNTKDAIDKALSSVDTVPTANNYNLEYDNPFKLSGQKPADFGRAEFCEKAINSCDAFNNPEFAENCGISFDINGESFKGKPHMGGMYISQIDRGAQMKKAETVKTSNSPPYDPDKVFQPTLGKSSPGKFAITKDQCVVMKERIDCQAKQSFDTPNCTQCYTSRKFSRVDPKTPRQRTELIFMGEGIVSVESSNPELFKGTNYSYMRLSTSGGTGITLPDNAEGEHFTVTLSVGPGEDLSKAYIAGMLYAWTAKGLFKYDLYNLVESDSITKAKPKTAGAMSISEYPCLMMMIGNGQLGARLECIMPFTFLSTTSEDTLTCNNGPIITDARSAKFLNSGSCHTKESEPGKYSLDCLQEKFIQLGGTNKGSGYPSTSEKAAALMFDANNTPLSIDEITNNIYKKILAAATGRRGDGTTLSINEWSDMSIWANGKSINTPCDTPGEITNNCRSYLYNNMGAKSHIGPTYTLSMNFTSSTEGNNSMRGNNVYCTKNGQINPDTEEGKSLVPWYDKQNIEGIKMIYDAIHRDANDNTLSNDRRAHAIKLCYGIDIVEQ
jgi:hypothetical protein